MNIRDLIDTLSKLVAAGVVKETAEVSTEGCDCFGDIGKVSVDKDGSVTLERTN